MINRIETALKSKKLPISWIDNYGYIMSDAIKILINKDIQSNPDIKKISVISYHNLFIVSQDGKINPFGIPISGIWKEGFALDLHTLRSIYDGEDEYGNSVFDTTRTWIGNELNRLKYKLNKSHLESISCHSSNFIKEKNWGVDLIIPVPPSNTSRKFQPVYEIAIEISKQLNIKVDSKMLIKQRNTNQMKGINKEKRKNYLKDIFDIKQNACINKNILIIDDLFDSGSTLNAISDVILNKGKAKNVFVLTITKTRT